MRRARVTELQIDVGRRRLAAVRTWKRVDAGGSVAAAARSLSRPLPPPPSRLPTSTGELLPLPPKYASVPVAWQAGACSVPHTTLHAYHTFGTG